jgi:ribosomal protein S18 acetylase RimI-like enzyme
MTMQLRVYRDEDFDAVVALWNACEILKPHHEPRRELALVQQASNAELFLRMDGERLVGSVLVGHDGHRAWMYRVAVDPGRRGRGHGRTLVALAEDWALARGLPKLMLMIRGGNEAVAGFYENLGYRREPRLVLSKSFTPDASPTANAHIDVVVTYLEMIEAPGRPSVPPPAGVNLALLRVGEPSVAFYRFLYAQVGDPWIWWERKLMDDAKLEAIIRDPNVELYVPYVGGSPAGYVEIDRRAAPEANLAYIGLIPRYIGVGLGWYLLNWALDVAWTGGTRRVTVDTCTLDHPRALQNYQRAGFQPYGQERKSIIDPRLAGRTPMQFEPRLP